MKTIFITGASSGLGKSAAKLFQQKGWRVIATMRSPERETELNRLPNISLMALDVTNPDQIKTIAAQAEAIAPIDVVFNNAGYGLSGPLEATTDDQLTRQIDTNLLGAIRVTQAFIPYFRERQAGLFLTTTSIGGLVGFPLSSLYQATKWALEGWSESMSFELKKFGIGIKTIAPGGIQTDFLNRSYDKSSHPAYDKWMNDFFARAEGAVFSTPDQIAAVVYEAATDGKEQLRYLAGDDAKAMYAKRVELGNDGFRNFMEQVFF